jgi:hypothetical protein
LKASEAKKIEDLFALRDVRGKRVYIVDDHHKAFAAWSLERRRLDAPPLLISFDHHTDTMEAADNIAARKFPSDDAARETYQAQVQRELGWDTDEAVLSSVSKLQHDEHIDAAALCGALRASFSIQLDHPSDWPVSEEETRRGEQTREAWIQRQQPPPKPRRPFTYAAPPLRNLFIVGHDCFVGCQAERHNDDCIRLQYSQILESAYVEEQLARAADMARCISIEGGVESVPYILDIDLDVFHTAAAVEPKDPASFYRLIRGAVAITIATEADFVEGMWWKDEARKLTADELLATVMGHIDRALAV